MAAKQPKCEVKTHLACTGMAVRRMTGKQKGDPVFYCCFGWEAYLRRWGVKLKEYSGAKKQAAKARTGSKPARALR
jgi:hypothetical protein